MDTLPIEIVTYIAQMLRPSDLACCSAVSQKWREVFNRDIFWQPLCDPLLVEPLQTTPFFTPPPFQSPETKNSTLPPLCQWRLVFMRENHLWNNWRRFSKIEYRKILPDCFLGDCKRIDFLTDSLIMAFRQNEIGILDVRRVPAILVAKSSHGSVKADLGHFKFEFRAKTTKCLDIEACASGSIIATILVLRTQHLVVYDVDATKKSIQERETVSLGNVMTHTIMGKYYTGLNVDSLMLHNLETGKSIKKEPIPSEVTKNGADEYEIRISPSYDFIIVCFTSRLDIENKLKKFYIFDLKKLIFLPGPLCEKENGVSFTINGQYLAVCDKTNLSIYNCLTRDLVLHQTRTLADLVPIAFNNAFIMSDHEVLEIGLKLYFPSTRTFITLCKHFDNPLDKFNETYKIVTFHDRFIAFLNNEEHRIKGLWTVTGTTVKRFQNEYLCKCIPYGYISPSFTKVLCKVENKNIPKEYYFHPYDPQVSQCVPYWPEYDPHYSGCTTHYQNPQDFQPQIKMFPKWYIKHLW